MKYELYQAETDKVCAEMELILLEAGRVFENNEGLSLMEKQGVIHSVQVIVENAIGKAKHILKKNQLDVPVSAHDSFESLFLNSVISSEDFEDWRKIIGLRNAIVHEYMNINFDIIKSIVIKREYAFVLKFLRDKSYLG